MKVTIREVAEAMIKDPTPQAKAHLFDFDNWRVPSDVTASCAIGGAALVLGVDADRLFSQLCNVDRDGVPSVSDFDEELSTAIWYRNDSLGTPKAEIGKAILDHADEKTLNTVLNVAKERRAMYRKAREKFGIA